MNIDIVNFARHAKPKQLRWMVGRQIPEWIQEMLRRKKAGADPGELIEELAAVCSVDEETEVLEL